MKQILTALIFAATAAAVFTGCSHSCVSGEMQKEEQKEQDSRWFRFELTNEDGTAIQDESVKMGIKLSSTLWIAPLGLFYFPGRSDLAHVVFQFENQSVSYDGKTLLLNGQYYITADKNDMVKKIPDNPEKTQSPVKTGGFILKGTVNDKPCSIEFKKDTKVFLGYQDGTWAVTFPLRQEAGK